MKKNIIAINILLLFIINSAYSQTNKPTKEHNNQKNVQFQNVQFQKRIVAKFIEAATLEGAGTYTFKDAKGKKISFVFDDYYNQKLPYRFFNNEALTNEEFINAIFDIKYISKYEIRSDNEDKILVNKILKIKLIKK